MILTICFTQDISNKINAGDMSQVEYWSSECFWNNDIEKCKIGLRIVEDFQSFASSQDNYSCQSRLLALEAHMIMVIINESDKSINQKKALDDVRENCRSVLTIKK